jgi:hypothetical protein
MGEALSEYSTTISSERNSEDLIIDILRHVSVFLYYHFATST